jgi:hypothetical protein
MRIEIRTERGQHRAWSRIRSTPSEGVGKRQKETRRVTGVLTNVRTIHAHATAALTRADFA